MKPRPIFHPLLIGVSVLPLLCLTVSCATANQTSATAFSTGVTAARAQTQTAFDAIVTTMRAASIDYASKQPMLNEGTVVSVPNAEAVAAWNGVLGPIEHYAQHLSALASGGAATGTEDAIGALAGEFNTVSSSLKSQGGLGKAGQVAVGPASALAAVAGALERARALKQVNELAKATNGEIRGMLTALADAIGASPATGLRGTVRASWDDQLIQITEDFQRAGSPAQRVPAVRDFVDTLSKRDAQDAQLASLRSSYLALADAHSAIAKGNEGEVRGALDFIMGELKHARDLQAQFAKTLPN